MKYSYCFWFQIKSHQRVPSGNQEFLEITKRDAENRLQLELERLLDKSSPIDKPKFKKEFDGFQRLFDRFMRESGPSIDWNKIEKLPPGAVSVNYLFYPSLKYAFLLLVIFVYIQLKL